MGWPGAAGSGQSPRGPGAAKLRLTQQLCRDAESSVGMLTNEAAPEGQLLPPPAALRQPGGASICHPWGGQSRSRQLCFPLRLLSPAQRDGISVDPDPAGPAPPSLQPTAPQGCWKSWHQPRQVSQQSARGLQLCWSRRAPAQLKGGQWLQSSGLEGWGRLGPAWKLSSLQGGGQRGGGASPQSCTALTLEQDPNTADQSRSAEPGSTRLPQACYIQIYTCLTVYYI